MHIGILRWAARLLLLALAQPLAAADESADTPAPAGGDAAQDTGAPPNHVDDAAAAAADAAAPADLGAGSEKAGLIEMIMEMEWTTIALTLLIAIAVFAAVTQHAMGQKKKAEPEEEEEEEEEKAEEEEAEAEPKKTEAGAESSAPEAAEKKGISEPELLRKFDRLPMWTIVDGRARPLALEDGKPHFWVDFDEALAKVGAVRKEASQEQLGEIMLRVVGMGQALAIASQGGVVERRKADVEYAKSLPCKDNVDWEKSTNLLPLFVCHGMLQVMPDGKRVQPIFLRGEDARGAMDAAKKANEGSGKESALELRTVALQKMAQLLLTGMIPDPDYIRFVPSSRSIQAIRDLEEAKEKADEEEKKNPADPDDDPPPLE